MIYHLPFRKNRQLGFTLIELLVSMAVLISVGVIIGAILYTSLRGTAKTSAVIQVTKNGNYVIAQMVKTIRNAEQFEGVSIDGTDDDDYATSCFIPPATITPPAPAPTITAYKSIRILSPDEGIVTFTCGSTTINKKIVTGGTPGVPFSLLDTSAVSLVDCSFTCSQRSASEVPTITIQFSLEQYQSNALSENTAAAPFQSSVSMRNTSR